MKKITLIMLMLISAGAFSQQKDIAKKERTPRVEMSSEQRAVIAAKRMALALDLTENQRLEIEKLNLQLAQERKELMKDRQQLRKKNSKKRISRINAKLDKDLEYQDKMKSILTEEQYSQWKKSKQRPVKKKISVKKKTI